MLVRKTLNFREVIHTEAEKKLDRKLIRAVGLVAFRNPFANQGYVENLEKLFDLGMEAGKLLSDSTAKLVGQQIVSYGKAAIVGVLGQIEHGAACIHPKLGGPMRQAIGGGKALIPSNCIIGGIGTAVNVPLGNKDDPWSFPSFDTITVNLADGPLPDEIIVIVAFSSGDRVFPRVGTGPITLAPE